MAKKIIRITTVPMALKYLLAGQMKYMQENGFDVLIISADGQELADVIKNEGCRHLIVPMTRKITPFRDLKCLFQLIKIFRSEKPDIVHSHTPKAGLLGMLAARYCRIKTRIHTVAGMPLMSATGIKRNLLTYIEKLTYKSATHIWPNSFSLRDYILEHRLAPEKKLMVISRGSSNGVDVDRFDRAKIQPEILNNIKTSLNYNIENEYLLCIGRLVKDKGIPELVKVFNSLKKDYPYLMLILVGRFEQDLDPLPKDIIHEIRSNPDIIHVEWSDQVEYYMELANYFIFPSHREGFPNVLLQAAAMELPIICSRIEGNIDIVEHVYTGLMFDKGDEEQLMEQIEYAVNHPEDMRFMADTLYGYITKGFARETIWNKLLEAYNQLT